MAFCENCGAKLAPGARFCEECGAPVADVSEAEATQEKSVRLSERPAFCENCGAIKKLCQKASKLKGDELIIAKQIKVADDNAAKYYDFCEELFGEWLKGDNIII